MSYDFITKTKINLDLIKKKIHKKKEMMFVSEERFNFSRNIDALNKIQNFNILKVLVVKFTMKVLTFSKKKYNIFYLLGKINLNYFKNILV